MVVYTGFERIAKALLQADRLELNLLSVLMDAVALTDYGEPIALPERERGTRTSNAGQFESNLKPLLGGHPVKDWKGAIGLAQSLRHVITHGAMSPTKIQQLELRRAIVQLATDAGHVTTAIVSRFAG